MATTKKAKAEQQEQPETPTLTLTDLRPAKGATKAKLRVGRGRASGAGKTSNRGHNGEGQRSGRSSKRGFEGGQMPGYRQMPKLGHFHQPNVRKWLEINVSNLDRILGADETEVNYEALTRLGHLKCGMDGVRVIGNGKVTRKLTVHAHYVTPGARQQIEAAGGSVVIIEPAQKSAE